MRGGELGPSPGVDSTAVSNRCRKCGGRAHVLSEQAAMWARRLRGVSSVMTLATAPHANTFSEDELMLGEVEPSARFCPPWDSLMDMVWPLSNMRHWLFCSSWPTDYLWAVGARNPVHCKDLPSPLSAGVCDRAPTFLSPSGNQVLGPALGSVVALNCTAWVVSGPHCPLPSVQWLKDGQLLANGSHYNHHEDSW